jgi:hypothetical protein
LEKLPLGETVLSVLESDSEKHDAGTRKKNTPGDSEGSTLTKRDLLEHL